MALTDWVVRKASRLLEPGEKFVFAEDLGGEDEVLTVIYAKSYNGITEVLTEEYDFYIELIGTQWVTMA